MLISLFVFESQSIIQSLVRQLSKVRCQSVTIQAWGRLPGVPQLRVNLEGCTYAGGINEELEQQLQAWYTQAPLSGYGNVRDQRTEIDAAVRDAREIAAEHLEVSGDILRGVTAAWKTHFLPREVRVEPYKIHIYGPGGHFLPHRDTPAQDLVGTFLLGLGDTTPPNCKGNLRVGTVYHRATPGSWVAFYPDVPHEVTPLESGYRAVLAFKVFRRDVDDESSLSDGASNTSEADEPRQMPRSLDQNGDEYAQKLGDSRILNVVNALQRILADTPLPLGLHFTHKYPRGITQPSGFDAMLLRAAHKLPHADVRFIPVVTEENIHNDYTYEVEATSYGTAWVYPLSEAHLEYLLDDISKDALLHDEVGSWASTLRGVPFYSLNENPKDPIDETHHSHELLGNDCSIDDDCSIYMTYALIITPSPDPVHAVEEGTAASPSEAAVCAETDEANTDNDGDVSSGDALAHKRKASQTSVLTSSPGKDGSDAKRAKP